MIVAAALDRGDLFIAQGLHQVDELRGVLDPMFSHYIARRDGVHLIVTVDGLLHALLQYPLDIALE